MRGRKPKPVELQIAEGDPRKKGTRKLKEQAKSGPKASSGLPDCPRHLKGRARYAWNLWSEELAAMKLDKRPDAMKLEGACVAYARAVDADLILQREGITVSEKFVAENGEVIILKIRKHPAVEISNRSWAAVRSFGSDFGFDPVSRSRMTITPSKSAGDDSRAKLIAALSQPRGTPAVNTAIN